MCLASLLNFEQPEDPSKIITQAIQIKNELLEIKQALEEDLLDFESIDADPDTIETTKTTSSGGKKNQPVKKPKKFLFNLNIPQNLMTLMKKENSQELKSPLKLSRSNSTLKKSLMKKQEELIKIEQYKDYVVQNNISPDQILKSQ
jgi:hypothetical protein